MRARDQFSLLARFFSLKGLISLKSFAWRAFGRARPASVRADEDAIRSELFGIEPKQGETLDAYVRAVREALGVTATSRGGGGYGVRR